MNDPLDDDGGTKSGSSNKASNHTWFDRFLKAMISGNPLLPISAALVLYGVSLLSLDESFLSNDLANLTFTFATLQFYEILLVVIAIVILRKGNHYDSAVLITLENMLLLVPFIFITHASMIQWKITWGFLLLGCVLVSLRNGAAKKFFPSGTFPRALTALGIAVLSVNASIPLIFRNLLDDPYADWSVISAALWFATLPVMAAALLLLPKTSFRLAPAHNCNWLPDLFFVSWIAATAVHIACVDWLDKRDFAFHKIAPSLWVMAWVLYFRAEVYFPRVSTCFRNTLMAIPVISPLLALPPNASSAYPIAVTLNLAILAFLLLRNRSDIWIRTALIAVACQLIAAAPPSWIPLSIDTDSQSRLIFLSIGIFALATSFLSNRPETIGLSLVGSIVAIQTLTAEHSMSIQLGCCLAFLRVLFWHQDVVREWTNAIAILGLLWIAHSLHLVLGEQLPVWPVVVSGSMVLLAYGARFLRTRSMTHLLVLTAGTTNLLVAPAIQGGRLLSLAPTGLLLLFGGFIALALGTMVANLKTRRKTG